MTQEEKAKRYDEALEELRGLLECVREDKREILEEDITSIFPELKESEDEKIRKVLVYYLKNYKKQRSDTTRFYGIPTDNILAWLEKQKAYTK